MLFPLGRRKSRAKSVEIVTGSNRIGRRFAKFWWPADVRGTVLVLTRLGTSLYIEEEAFQLPFTWQGV